MILKLTLEIDGFDNQAMTETSPEELREHLLDSLQNGLADSMQPLGLIGATFRDYNGNKVGEIVSQIFQD